MSEGPRVQRADPPAVGDPLEVVFEGLSPNRPYRVHLLLPSGASIYRKVTSTKNGTVPFKYDPTDTPALHVVELHEGPHDEREVVAVAHVVVLPAE